MVKIGLQVKANLENIESLKPQEESFKWYMKFACNNCGEVSSKWNYIMLEDEKPAQRGSGVTHYVTKCKLCARENSLTILPDTISEIKADTCDQFKTIVVFDCRGLEPKDFSAREGWIASVDGGTTFNNVDLSEGDWADYCDKTKQPVSISCIEHNFVRVK
ncbi:UPF0587 protein C1orf123 homolog [Copidosoma floridanum]|uniref:UPF0587 protein C1orf123 homolog n=1 Tax=Copidosoma floridanum TaxID=29053 RepID=UPI0006C9E579|nr:UPF0587 protein C1orf123 homolog [Copidosoma floridanum]